MKKALLLVALVLVPFLSLADLFTTAQGQPPKTVQFYPLTCSVNVYSTYKSVELTTNTDDLTTNRQTCSQEVIPLFCSIATSNGYTACSFVSWNGATGNTYSVTNGSGSTSNQSASFGALVGELTQSDQCPPDNYPDNTYAKLDINGDIESCYNPNDLNLLDSCNSTDVDTVLNLQVTDAVGCFPQSDGSSCKYQAVDVGDGNQVYELDLEGDCYSDPQPDISGNTPIGSTPIDESCTNNGGLLACPADPDVMCPNGQCETGCGYVNNEFLCYGGDTDNDGLPDYNDPDIDGDGIPNKDDLDSNGDGIDDPIYSGGGGAGAATIDLSPVVNELIKANSSLDNIENAITGTGTADDLDKDGRLTSKNDAYETKVNDFKDKTASELGYVDGLNLANTGFAALVPADSCQIYTLPVGGYSFDLDFCTVSGHINIFLTFFFGFATAFYVFYRINSTLRGDS